MTIDVNGKPEIKSLLAKSYDLFERGDFAEAQSVLDKAHGLDFEDPEVRAALKACGYWTSRAKRLDELAGEGAKGDFLRRQWRNFTEGFSAQLGHPFHEGRERLKAWAFGRAIACYDRLAGEDRDPEVLLQRGRCLKSLGRYSEAIETLEEAIRGTGPGNAGLLAELADAYALIGETKAAKVLFREALFQDPRKVSLDDLESPVFRRLIERLAVEKGYAGDALAEWLPVYGVLWGVLDVTRELKPVEYGKLKQSIYALKSEIADGDDGSGLKPRLINRYFWLIDHYQNANEDRRTVEEALMNIKLLSPSVYRAYTE